MIKIDVNKEYKSLSENPSLNNLVLDYKDIASSTFDLDERHISICAIAESLEYTKPLTYIQILVLPSRSYADLLTDITALRKYDSSSKVNHDKEITLKHELGKIFITHNQNLVNTALRFDILGDELLEETITIEIDDILITKTKDLSKIPLVQTAVSKIINIKT